jgi:hypothetical protein
MFVGLIAYVAVLQIFELPRLGIFSVIGIVLLMSVLEVNLLAKMPKRLIRCSLLDGKMFPFVSVGVGAGMIIL